MYNYFIIFFLSAVKYVIGVGYALTWVDNIALAFSTVLLGSVTGVFVFTLGGYTLMAYLRQRYKWKKKVFTKVNRLIIKFKKSGGLPIIAVLTPVLFSIPVGCIAAVLIYDNRKKVISYMLVSVVFWTIVLFGSKLMFGLNLKEILN